MQKKDHGLWGTVWRIQPYFCLVAVHGFMPRKRLLHPFLPISSCATNGTFGRNWYSRIMFWALGYLICGLFVSLFVI
ncbi:MAG: hypothetical protein J0L94_10535 [Rhodothermia bacterium]|nr:hypothetical protein [Rhodothermia bacterium]